MITTHTLRRLSLLAITTTVLTPAWAQDAIVSDSTFTANDTTDGGGYVFLSDLPSATLTGGETLEFNATNAGDEKGAYSLVYRSFDGQALEFGESLTLSFTVVNLSPGFDTIRSFGFGFVGNIEGGLPDSNTTPAFTKGNEYYSLTGVLSPGIDRGQFVYSGVRGAYRSDSGANPLKSIGIKGGMQDNSGGGVTEASQVSFRITRTDDTLDGKPQFITAMQVSRSGGSPDEKKPVTLSSPHGPATDLTVWGGLVIGAAGAFPEGQDVRFAVDDVTVTRSAE